MDIVIATNSPGELYSFVKPTICALHKTMPSARIILVLTPCQYASGREIEVARSFKEIYEIILPQEFTKWALKNIAPRGINFSKKGAVLFMGGDLFNGIILSKKLDYPAFAYSMHRIAWSKQYTTFFVPDDNMFRKAVRKRVPKENIMVVGDLMVDNVESKALKKDFDLDPRFKAVTFLPGSREAHLKFMAPFFVKAAQSINLKDKNIQFIFGLSPFTNISKIHELIGAAGIKNRIISKGSLKYLKFSDNLEILALENRPYDAMNIADLIITIPGTNTAEAAALAKPMLATVPFNDTSTYLFDGAVGILGSAPIIGNLIKKLAVFALNKLVKFIALPNIKAKKIVVPEMRGNLTSENVADYALIMLSDAQLLADMSSKLKSLAGPRGASQKIADEIARVLSK